METIRSRQLYVVLCHQGGPKMYWKEVGQPESVAETPGLAGEGLRDRNLAETTRGKVLKPVFNCPQRRAPARKTPRAKTSAAPAKPVSNRPLAQMGFNAYTGNLDFSQNIEPVYSYSLLISTRTRSTVALVEYGSYLENLLRSSNP
eukprot:scaffold48645_cov47-Prasinocladus_malaysianus.AAC.1